MTPEQEQQEREAFEAWVIEGELAYRDPYGLWFYASGDGRAYWEGWQARAQMAQAAPSEPEWKRQMRKEMVDELAFRRSEKMEAEQQAAQPADPVVGTKTWFDGEKLMTQELPASQVYKDAAAQEPIWCACGDGITPDSGAKCGTCAYVDSLPSTPARQPLTDAEIAAIVREAAKGSAIRRDGSTSLRIARAVERHHGIKGEQP